MLCVLLYQSNSPRRQDGKFGLDGEIAVRGGGEDTVFLFVFGLLSIIGTI
jgi:hypothetical protein